MSKPALPSIGSWKAPFRTMSKRLSRKGLNRFLDKQFSEIPAAVSVLCVGAGGRVGALLDFHAAQRGFAVESLDIDPTRRPDIVGDIARHDFGGRQYDYIVVIEVLEHVAEPHEAARNLLRALRSGGTLLLSTPFVFPLHDRPRDYFRYTRYGLAYLFRELSEVQIEERDNWCETIVVLCSRFINEDHWTCKVMMPAMVVGATLSQPLATVLGRLVVTDFITSGYLLVGRK